MAEAEEINLAKKQEKKRGCSRMGDAVYGLGLLGAAFYYIQHATSFGDGLLGVLKAVIWPAMIVFKLLGFLKM